ncbi:hypothetical protein BBJ28_00004209 [Nothophytophthora sp. Chile5]|nr:hypothetical protein BBJ28_00004209 [Nothophytophthora sp. Chile5]
MSRTQSMQIAIPTADATIELGFTEMKICVPMLQTGAHANTQAPIPSACSIICDLVRADLDFLHLLQLAHRQEQQRQSADLPRQAPIPPGTSDDSKVLDQLLFPLRLAEACPDNIRVLFRRLEINTTNKNSPSDTGAKCALALNNLEVSLCDASNQESGGVSATSGGYPIVKRKAAISLSALSIGLDGPDCHDNGATASSSIRLEGLKLDADTKITVDCVDLQNTLEESEDDGQPSLFCRSRISGEGRGLAVMIAKDIAPWVTSFSTHHRQVIRQVQEKATQVLTLEEEMDPTQSWSILDYTELEVDAQFKLLKSEVTFISLDRKCEVLPNGVPSICFSLEELSMFGHPFVGGEELGIRAKADMQCSRLKISYFMSDERATCAFLSLDFARIFISPVSLMMHNEMPAEVEMEAEWVEAKWAPEVLHAVGGMMEVGIVISASLLRETSHSVPEERGITEERSPAPSIQPMCKIADVVQDGVSPGEVIAFRCSIKRICVTFPYVYDGERRVDCVTVDTLAMSSEGTTGRFRLSILEGRAFPCSRQSDEARLFTVGASRKRATYRRRSFVSHASRSRNPRLIGAVSGGNTADKHDKVEISTEYLIADCFSLEESKVPGCAKTVLDLFLDGVRIEWDLPTQLRIMELVRRITFSCWEMIYRARSAHAFHCTPQDSIYNRPHGLNPPLDDVDECSRYERMFIGLANGSSGKLTRLHATNISVHAKLCEEIDVHLFVGVFGGDDLPSLWVFENASLTINKLEMIAVHGLQVRLTIDKQSDYVFRELEQTLRKRLAACRRTIPSLDQTLKDGLLLDIDGLKLRSSFDFPLQGYLNAIQKSFEPYQEQLATAMTPHWRPQQDLFYQLFLRPPVASGQKEIWLRLQNVKFECLGNRLESWLEKMYPLWIEELAEQDLRAQLLEDHVATLKLMNADPLCNDSYQEMKALLAEKNTKIYLQKTKKLQTRLHEAQEECAGALISVEVGHVNVDVSFEEDRATLLGRVRELDEATEAVESAFKDAGRDWASHEPSHLVLKGIQVKASVTELVVQMRRFPTPLVTCERIGIEGDVFLTAYSSGGQCACNNEAFDLMGAMRCFADLSLEIVGPILHFGPSYLYAMHELVELAKGLLPLAKPDVDTRCQTSAVDMTRRILHGKLRVSVQDAAVRLLNASTSFEFTDYLEVAVHRLDVTYSNGAIEIDVTRLTAKIEPAAVSNIAEISYLKLQIWLTWACHGDPAVHYVYPIEFVGMEHTSAAGEKFVLTFRGAESTNPGAGGESREDGSPFKAYQATELSVFVRGKICPVNPQSGDASSNDGWSKREIAARTAIVLYNKQVEWLIGFGRLYQKLPPYPLPRRRNRSAESNAPSFQLSSICKGITVEEFEFIGLDLALYASEKNPIGIRSFIDDKIYFSGAFLANSHEIFAINEAEGLDTSGRVRRLTTDLGDATWVVHDVIAIAQDIQVRVCTPQSGSRGESLVSVKHVSLKAGGGMERAPMHVNGLMAMYSPVPLKDPHTDRKLVFPSVSRSTNGGGHRSKKTILEHFDIAQNNPFRFRDSESDSEDETDAWEAPSRVDTIACQAPFFNECRRLGFLLGLFSKEIRVLATLGALETLVDIADTWVHVIVASLPELFADTAEIPDSSEQNGAPVAAATIEKRTETSPKKFTSLAEDPKFRKIFLQDDENAVEDRKFEPTPYSTSDSVRPAKRNSIEKVEQLKLPQAKETVEPPSQTAGSKLVRTFLMVKFEDCQINIQDQVHKGSVLLALNAGTLRDSVSAGSSHELIDLKVDGLQLFTAPLDIDVKSRATWLKTLADGSYCPSSYGLLKQVIAPLSTQVTISIDREKAVVKSNVKLHIPAIDVQLNSVSKDILHDLTTSATTLVTDKLAAIKGPEKSRVLHGYLRDTLHSPQHQRRSLEQLHDLQKQLKWRIASLQWRQMRRWNSHGNERAFAAFAAAESGRALSFEVEMSSLFRQRKLSSASILSATTDISMFGSTSTQYDDEPSTDELQRLTQQYESMSELVRAITHEAQEQSKQKLLPNVDLDFVLERASLTLSGENVDIFRVQMDALGFKMQLFEDNSGKFALTLQHLSANNLSPGTPYPDLLLPAYSRSWEGDDMFLRVDAEIAKPVSGLTVVQHFEVNVHPIQVCITQEMILQLIAFFSPPITTSSSKAEQREEIRSQFLQARTSTGSAVDGRVGLAIKKAVKVAGKAAAHPLSLGRTHRGDSDEDMFPSGRKSSADFGLGQQTLVPDDPSQWIAKLVSLSEPDEQHSFGLGDEQEPRQTEREKEQAKGSILFKRIRLGAVEVVLTYKNKRSSSTQLHLPHATPPQALEDMRGFEVKTHALVYCDKTCSPLDLLLRIRRDILLDVLSQVGRNFTNVGNFLRDQFDISRWAQIDALAPLKTLSTTVSSLAAHPATVKPLTASLEAESDPASASQFKDSPPSNATTLRPIKIPGPSLRDERLHGVSELPTHHEDADEDRTRTSSLKSLHDANTSQTPTSQLKPKRSLANLFSRKRAPSSPLSPPSES